MANEQESGNVNVTLAHPNAPARKLLGKEFPCPLCGSSMPIRLTRKGKPYCHCNSCMIQVFFRGKASIQRLQEIIKENPACRIVLAEKTDRLYRNFRDYILLEDLEVEIHLPKEGLIISKEAKSQTKLVHGIQVVIARNYIENLREEVRKGMREKAEQGIYPSRPPLGYRNNKVERTIEIDPERPPLRSAYLSCTPVESIPF